MTLTVLTGLLNSKSNNYGNFFFILLTFINELVQLANAILLLSTCILILAFLCGPVGTFTEITGQHVFIRGINFIFISSPEQCSRRAIVLPLALAAVLTSSNVKVFKTPLFPNLITDLIHLWYDDTYWSKTSCSTIPTALL